jgi:hypothetical protein
VLPGACPRSRSTFRPDASSSSRAVVATGVGVHFPDPKMRAVVTRIRNRPALLALFSAALVSSSECEQNRKWAAPDPCWTTSNGFPVRAAA